MNNKLSRVVYRTKHYPDTEFEAVHNLSIRRYPDGDVGIYIATRREGQDDVTTSYHTTKEEAAAIAAALLGTHAGFTDITERATRKQ